MKLLTISAAEYQELREKLDTIQKTLEQSGQSNDWEPWVDSQTVCKILKISLRTLQKLRDEAKISFSRPGAGIIRYKISDINSYMEENYVSGSRDN